MRPPDFRFQQFSIWQDQCAMKVGTDSLLLGALAKPEVQVHRALDVGTGTGIVALLLAQRFPALTITALDVDTAAKKQAEENCAASPFTDRISVLQADIRDYDSFQPFDWIISNPPFHTESRPASGKRALARQASALAPEELVASSLALLSPIGQLTLIGPPRYIKACSMTALQHKYTLSHIIKVRPSPQASVHRWIASWSRSDSPLRTTELSIREPGGAYTKAYKAATQAFYLKD